MKIEPTNELKARFFAQYLYQEVLGMKYIDNHVQLLTPTSLNGIAPGNHLALTDLSSIKDEDSIECFDLLFPNSGCTKALKLDLVGRWLLLMDKESGGYLPKNYVTFIDTLRSKRYAIPFMGYSVEELVELGWIKLSK